jgi:eukaryotic-like serine/threonine-protein kinase
MKPDRWEEIDRVWHAVLARPEHERATAVIEICGSDLELRRDVQSLLMHRARASAAGFGVLNDVSRHHDSLIGRQLGPFTVQKLLGVGGMGEVYQAHDSSQKLRPSRRRLRKPSKLLTSTESSIAI